MAFEIPKKKITFPWLVISLIIVAIIIGTLFWSLYKPVDYAEDRQAAELLDPMAAQVQRARLNIDVVLNNPLFQRLQTSVNWPLILPELGRENPFVPVPVRR